MARATLSSTLARLKAGPVVPLPSDEEWADMLIRTTRPGRVCEVEEATYHYLRFSRIPRWSAPTGEWAYSDSNDPLTLFWKDGGKCFCRYLTPAETSSLRALPVGPPPASGNGPTAKAVSPRQPKGPGRGTRQTTQPQSDDGSPSVRS